MTTLVNTETGQLVDQMFGDMFTRLADAFLMSDDEMFAGLDDRTVSDLRIGSASNPAARLRALSTGSPEPLRLLATAPGGERRERELHARFAPDRVRGEWFRPSAELLAVVGGGA